MYGGIMRLQKTFIRRSHFQVYWVKACVWSQGEQNLRDRSQCGPKSVFCGCESLGVTGLAQSKGLAPELSGELTPSILPLGPCGRGRTYLSLYL